jgi:hypothetical protein
VKRSGVQLRLWWIMAAVAVAACLFALPAGGQLAFAVVALPPSLVAAAAFAAPVSRRAEAAYWTMALHPLLPLIWLSVWRFCLDTGPAAIEGSWYYPLVFGLPYSILLLSILYQPACFVCGLGWAVRYARGNPSVALALIVLLLVWVTTLLAVMNGLFWTSIWNGL